MILAQSSVMAMVVVVVAVVAIVVAVAVVAVVAVVIDDRSCLHCASCQRPRKAGRFHHGIRM